MADQIRKTVRQYYAERARTSTSCCGPGAASCCGPGALYPQNLLEGLPQELTAFSLGCGKC